MIGGDPHEGIGVAHEELDDGACALRDRTIRTGAQSPMSDRECIRLTSHGGRRFDHAAMRYDDRMQDVDLHLAPNEASDLCPVFGPQVLERHGWDRAFVTVLDEAHVARAIAVICHAQGADEDTGWTATRTKAKPSAKFKTEDAEACARWNGAVYVLGSQFGKKEGPLEAKRSFIGRVSEDELHRALHGKSAKMDLVALKFALHRAVNDALAAAQVELLPLGPTTRSAYIDETMFRGARKGKSWSGRVVASDQPINVEGAEFRADGRMLLGLRYPVTAAGQPILVELEDPDALFDGSGSIPRCSNVWVLQTGSGAAPVGVRALGGDAPDAFHAIVGNLDSAGKGAAVLEDHAEGAVAPSTHVRFELPAFAAGGDVAVEPVQEFDDVSRVEGVAITPGGRVHYVIDREGRVDLRTLATGA